MIAHLKGATILENIDNQSIIDKQSIGEKIDGSIKFAGVDYIILIPLFKVISNFPKTDQ